LPLSIKSTNFGETSIEGEGEFHAVDAGHSSVRTQYPVESVDAGGTQRVLSQTTLSNSTVVLEVRRLIRVEFPPSAFGTWKARFLLVGRRGKRNHKEIWLRTEQLPAEHLLNSRLQMRVFRCNCEVPKANKTNENRSVRRGQGELANRRIQPLFRLSGVLRLDRLSLRPETAHLANSEGIESKLPPQISKMPHSS
jgi:hypothetical protein